MSKMNVTSRFLFVSTVLAVVPALFAMDHPAPGVAPGTGARYATDAYPGFDSEDEILSPSRKEPRWFAFINGPNRENAAAQFSYCRELIAAGDLSKACKQLDALVREWPTAPEAARAQQLLAEVLFGKLADYEEAFAEYRYLLDFYSLQCDYDAVADRLYEIAGCLKAEGKEVMFVRFANTVDVRRAYEACVLHAPGAAWVPTAMLTIGSLREDEGKLGEAIKVYENLRNIYPAADEAKMALMREASMRMKLLVEHGYNRGRCQDTVDFLQMALRACRPSDEEQLRGFLTQARQQIEDEAYLGAKFYDSPMRTVRSAITAYEKFLAEFPESSRAGEVRARIEVLKGSKK